MGSTDTTAPLRDSDVNAGLWLGYDARFTPGGFQVPSPTGRIEGGVSFGQ
jgi:hypothetical protein